MFKQIVIVFLMQEMHNVRGEKFNMHVEKAE